MLGLAKRLKCRILQASTSEVYGDPAVHPQTEDYWGHVNPIGPRSCYDEGKRCAETLFFDYQRQQRARDQGRAHLQYLWPAHAPERRPRGVQLYHPGARGEPITLYGDGSQTRSFCYVDDLVDGLVRLMDSPASFTGPVNLGNPNEFTMRELAELVLVETGSSSQFINLPLPQDDPKQRQPNIALAKAALGWEPKVKLAEGLKPTVAFFRNQDHAETAVNISESSEPTPATIMKRGGGTRAR